MHNIYTVYSKLASIDCSSRRSTIFGMPKPSVKRLTKLTMKKNLPSVVKSAMLKAKKKQHWSLGLVDAINDGETIVEEDELIVVIKDKYPKARYHYLVMPKKDISAINKVTQEDLALLKHMGSIADKYVNLHKDYEFIVGYHAIPSMYRLHLHVISTDFDSPCLKTLKHWNSFTTPYFLSSTDIIKQLEETGEIKVNVQLNNEYLKTRLICHKCSYTPKNVPDLKKHIIQHISVK